MTCFPLEARHCFLFLTGFSLSSFPKFDDYGCGHGFLWVYPLWNLFCFLISVVFVLCQIWEVSRLCFLNTFSAHFLLSGGNPVIIQWYGCQMICYSPTVPEALHGSSKSSFSQMVHIRKFLYSVSCLLSHSSVPSTMPLTHSPSVFSNSLLWCWCCYWKLLLRPFPKLLATTCAEEWFS